MRSWCILFWKQLAPLVCNLMHIEFNEGFEMPAVGGYLIYTLLGYSDR